MKAQFLIALLYSATSYSSIISHNKHNNDAYVESEVELDVTGNTLKDDGQIEELYNKNQLKLQQNNSQDDDICGIWLAPSTIEGSGLGMYAGKVYKKGDLLSSDLAIAISDIEYHQDKDKLKNFLWDEYTWNANILNMISEGRITVNVASPGFGSAANSFISLHNVEEYNPIIQYSPPMTIHRSTHPGAGASTYFHQRDSKAISNIQSGQELFVNYGNDWFTKRPQLGPVPLKKDLDHATALLKKYKTLSTYLTKVGVNDDVINDIWTTFVKNTKFIDSRIIIGAFHHNNPDEMEILQTKYDNNVKALRIDESIRNLEWLEKNGVCGDHIYGAPSTITQANMGAFATRNLKAGTVVALLPMIHIANRTVFDMYQLNSMGGRMFNTPITQQLLLNYCYGHSESSLLLCPYGPIVNYINHNQTRANVKLQWSNTCSDIADLRDQTLEDWALSGGAARVSMEVVAIRDIDKDEEIFLDYGNEWEEAWNKHVANWRAVKGSENYVSAGQMNAKLGKERLRTVFEENRENTYPSNVELKCDMTFDTEPDKVAKAIKEGRLDQYLRDEEGEWAPCEVLRYTTNKENNNNGEYLYTVYIFNTKIDGMKEKKKLVNIPWQAFHFVNKKITSDTFIWKAFRHDIRISDDIFPEKWKNKIIENKK